ncbi:hypothetical protein MNBD_GAMMA26-2391 [hydrothermal vent metagenome]|uniref:Cytochrome c7-like domain-containing protein n=1 Tax=hydrothermal vent metagenome TaxID=652676 RepID=A0A3B1BFG0_9ZZZZ
MKSPASIHTRYAIIVVLLSLVFVASCKQADTQGQSQKPASKASSVAVAPTPKASPASATKEKAKSVIKQAVTKKVAVDKPKQMVASSSAPTLSVKKPGIKKKPVVASKFGPGDPRSGIYLSITGDMAGMGDPSQSASEAYRIGQGEHPEALAGAGLPKDKFGLIDWMAIVNDGTIAPRSSLKAGVPDIPSFDMDVLIESKGDFVNDVLFPHKAHTYWLKCENCHTGIFIMAKGKNNMTMQGIVQGEWCGRCHGKVAFPLTDCNRCHQTPKGAKKVSTAAAKK